MYTGSTAVTSQIYPDDPLDSGISQVECDGSETSLSECRVNYLSPTVANQEDAAVVCQAQSSLISNCSNGDIRLVSGTTDLEGRLEICINKVWGTVCSQGFTADDAEVVCTQLNLPFNGMYVLLPPICQSLCCVEIEVVSPHLQTYTGSRVFRDLTFGEGSGPIFLDRVTCSSKNITLLECDSNPVGVHECSHSQDVGVQCIGMKKHAYCTV